MTSEGLGQCGHVAGQVAGQQALELAVPSNQPVEPLRELAGGGIEVLPHDVLHVVLGFAGVRRQQFAQRGQQPLAFLAHDRSVDRAGGAQQGQHAHP